MRRASFEADLAIEGPGTRITVTAEDGDLVVTTDELRPVVDSLRGDGVLPSGTLRRVSEGLADVGATVRVRTRSTGLLTLGSGAEATWLTRAAGLHHVRVESARGLLVALRPPWRALLAGAAVAASAVVALRRRGRGRS